MPNRTPQKFNGQTRISSPPAAEFRDNVGWEKFWVADRNIDVSIRNIHESIYNAFKIFYKLNFVKQDVIIAVVCYQTFNMAIQFGIE